MFKKSSSNNFQMIAISTLKMMMLLPKLTMKKMKTLDNLIVGHPSHNGFPMDVSSLGVGSHYKLG
jgi:hypothetical protein